MTTLLTGLTVGYPFLISAGLALGRPRLVTMALGAVLLVLGVFTWRSGYRTETLWRLAEVGLMAGFLLLAAIVNEAHVFRLWPALANVAMLLSFGRTLLGGPSMVESIARLWRGELPGAAVAYCRRLTGVWCVFFALNGGLSTWLAFYGSLAAWTIYTGVLSYLLAGGLFAVELAYRRRRFASRAA
jgi:uncharacterized membrane protein